MKKFATFIFLGLIISACSPTPPSDYLEGEIISIGGDYEKIQPKAERNGLIGFSNETVKINTNDVVFSVKTKLGDYIIQLDPTDGGGSPGPQTVSNVKFALKRGTKIKFPTNYHKRKNRQNNPMGFSKSRVGMVDPDDIEILD